MSVTAVEHPPHIVEGDLSPSVLVTGEVTEREWTAYVERHPQATVDHQWQWRDVFQRTFSQESRHLVARRDGTIVGVLPLVLFRSRLFGRLAISVPYLNYGGVLADDRETAFALIDEAGRVGRAFRASYVELRHSERLAPDLPCRQHKVAMRLALPGTADDLWKVIDRKVRNQVRKAQKEGLTSVSGGAELVDEFYAVFAENMRDLGTPVYSKRLFTETLRAFPDSALVHLVRHDHKAIAGSVTVAFRDTVQVPWASALRRHRQLCPNMLLYWSMLERSMETGARTFDFGRSSIGSSTYRFKQQWGASEIPLHWEYVLLTRSKTPGHGPDDSGFGMAIATWRRLPVWLATRLGPTVVRNIP